MYPNSHLATMTSANLTHLNKTCGLALGAIIATCFVGSAHSQQSECEKVIQLHGFLKAGEHECKYEYDGYRIDFLRQCSQPLSDGVFEDIYREGQFAFDRNVDEKGKEQTCWDILLEFPGIVRSRYKIHRQD